MYAVYYGRHLEQVWAHGLPTDAAHQSSWLEMGGVASLLVKAEWHAFLVLAPGWLTPLAVTLVVMGVCTALATLQVRVVAGVYLAFFLIAGKSFDGYWGLLAWPTWALASGYGLQAVFDAAHTVVAGFHRGTLDA